MKLKKIEVEVEYRRFLINLVNMAEDLNRNRELITSIETSFVAPDTKKSYPVKVLIAARYMSTGIADESDQGTNYTHTIIIEGITILPMER